MYTEKAKGTFCKQKERYAIHEFIPRTVDVPTVAGKNMAALTGFVLCSTLSGVTTQLEPQFFITFQSVSLFFSSSLYFVKLIQKALE